MRSCYQWHKWLLKFQIKSASLTHSRSLSVLTSGDDPLEADDVGMVELTQDSRLRKERAPLFLWATAPQRLDGHRQLALTGQLQAATAHLTKITYGGYKLINITITV